MNPLTDAIKMGATPENILVDEYPRNDIWAFESAQDPQDLPEFFRTFDGLCPTTCNDFLLIHNRNLLKLGPQS